MDAKVDFCNDIKQKNLIARSGRSRYLSKPRELTQKKMVAMNGPVKTWPNLPGFWDRCEFLRVSEGLSVKEFSAKAGVSPAAFYRWKKKAIPYKSTLRRISEEFKCPIAWLAGQYFQAEPEDKDQEQEDVKPSPVNEPEFLGFELRLCGNYTGAEIKGIIGSLSDDKEYRAQVVVSK